MSRFVSSDGSTVGEITTLPGCAAVAISHAVFVQPDLRGRGHGMAAHKERLNEMKRLGYTYALCTTRSENTVQNAILTRNGWLRLSSFSSPQTGNAVWLWGKHLA